MLFAVASILFTAWVLGVLNSIMLGGYIHLLAILSVLTVIARLIQPEKTN